MGLDCRLQAVDRSWTIDRDGSEKAVAATSNRFHKAGVLGRVAQCLPNFADGLVEPMVEIYESVRGPKLSLQLLASNKLARMREKQGKILEGLFLKPDSPAVLAQFAGAKIQLEHSKT